MSKAVFIEIRGVQFVNKGAYLMLLACLEQIRLLWPQARIVLAPNQNSPYDERIRVGAWQKLSFRYRGIDLNRLAYLVPQRIRLILQRHFGLVMEPEIALVLDASGFSYGDQWGGRAVRVLAGEILRLAARQKGYILLPQAFGPFTNAADRRALRKALPKALLVCPRDAVSASAIGELAASDNICQFGDFTNLVAAKLPAETLQGLQPFALVIPNSAMMSERNTDNRWRQQYLPFLHTAIASIEASGLIPILLNHEGQVDLAICQQLQQQYPALQLLNPQHPLQVKGWIASAELVISSRFHGCVSALSSGVPCIGTSWSHKYEMLFAEYGQSEAIVQPALSAVDLTSLINRLRQPDNRAQIRQHAATWHEQSELLWQTVARVVEQARNSGRVNI